MNYLDVTCPTCQAESGDRCGIGAFELTYPHKARKDLADKAVRLPFDKDYPEIDFCDILPGDRVRVTDVHSDGVTCSQSVFTVKSRAATVLFDSTDEQIVREKPLFGFSRTIELVDRPGQETKFDVPVPEALRTFADRLVNRLDSRRNIAMDLRALASLMERKDLS